MFFFYLGLKLYQTMSNDFTDIRIIELIKNLTNSNFKGKEINAALIDGGVKNVPNHTVCISKITKHDYSPPKAIILESDKVIPILEQLYSNLKKRVKIVLTGEYKLFFSNTSQRGEDKKYNDHFTLRISDTSATIYKMENGNRGSVAFAGDLEWVSDVACFNLKSKTEKQDRIFWMIRVKENSSDEYFSGLYLTINDKNQPTGGNFIIIKSNLAIDNNKLTRAFFLAIDNIGNGKLAVLDLLDREVKKTVFSNLAKIDKIAGYWKAIRWNEEASNKT